MTMMTSSSSSISSSSSTSRRLLAAALSTTLTLSAIPSVSALDVLIKAVKCESRPVQFQFDYICNGDYLCTFGEVESMEGSFNYYGLVDQENATANDSIVIDAKLYFHLTGYSHQQELMNGVVIPLCHDGMQADESNEGGACPNDGKYLFNTVYNMPEVDSSYISWAASGWSGEVVLDMYLNSTMDMVGKCTMEIETLVTGSFENGVFRSTPSAKTAALSVFGLLALMLAFCLYRCCCKSKHDPRKEGLLQEEYDTTTTTTVPPADDNEPTTEYHQQLNKVKKDATYLL